MTLPQSTEYALKWLSQSGVRHKEPDSVAFGGVNQGYNWQEHSYPFVYTEITGYAVSMFVCAHQWTGDERYMAWAKEAMGYLSRYQEQADEATTGSIVQGLTLPGLQAMPQYYSFDLAMCLQGVMDLHRAAPSDEVQQVGRKIGDWLVNRMQQADGSFLAWYDRETGVWQHPGENFFNDFGCLHGKHPIGLLKLAEATGDSCYHDAALRVNNWVLALQNPDGSIRSSTTQSQIVSHPHCYATEGLLYTHYVTGDDRCLQAAVRAGEWLLQVQNGDGSINIEYGKPWWRMGRRVVERIVPKRVTDATAQAARIWLLLYYLKQDKRFLQAAQRAGTHLKKMQCTSGGDPNTVGAFFFWPGHPIMFTWATMFAAHALYALANVDRADGYTHLITELF
jgi:uncharacterized protein YyaL (SSP411 family)